MVNPKEREKKKVAWTYNPKGGCSLKGKDSFFLRGREKAAYCMEGGKSIIFPEGRRVRL